MKVSAAAGGGIVFGFSYLASCKSPEREHFFPELEMPSSWETLNGYIKIGDNNVITIYSPNPEIGQNVKTSMPMIVAEELDADWDKVVVEQAPLDTENFKRQVAGGSQSIRFSWEDLRTAGAKAKAVLIAAAAEQWGVDASTLTAEKSHVIHPDGQKLTYGELSVAASKLEAPEKVTLKNVSDFTLIGQGKGNVDLKKIITGAPLYGIDTKKEGMSYATILRAPSFGQKLGSYDDSAARTVNGVEEVISFDDKIAVVASSTWAAMKGKKALTAEWTQDTPAESSDYHNKKLDELLEQKGESRREDGDVDKAFAEADFVLSRTYAAPFLPHNCLEPMNFYAHVTEGKAYCEGPIQTPQGTARRLSSELGLEPSDVHVMMSRMGGGFGRRLYGGFMIEAAKISKETGKPIQLVYTREDDMNEGTYRPACKYRISASVKDGKVTGYHLVEACVNNNMYGLIPNFFPAGAIPNLKIDTYKFDSNITTGAWRAPYTNFLASAEQSFFDELAEKMEVDAVQLRLDLLEDAKANQDDERMQWSPSRMQEVVRVAAEKSGWGKTGDNEHLGFCAYYCHNTHVAEVAKVTVKDGTPQLTDIYCVVDCGIVVNPTAATNLVEGGVIDGVGHAMYSDFSFNDGRASSGNFDSYRLIRHKEAPRVHVHFIENNLDPTGLGEPTLPPAGAAIANAMYRATKERWYNQPYAKDQEIIG